MLKGKVMTNNKDNTSSVPVVSVPVRSSSTLLLVTMKLTNRDVKYLLVWSNFRTVQGSCCNLFAVSSHGLV